MLLLSDTTFLPTSTYLGLGHFSRIIVPALMFLLHSLGTSVQAYINLPMFWLFADFCEFFLLEYEFLKGRLLCLIQLCTHSLLHYQNKQNLGQGQWRYVVPKPGFYLTLSAFRILQCFWNGQAIGCWQVLPESKSKCIVLCSSVTLFLTPQLTECSWLRHRFPQMHLLYLQTCSRLAPTRHPESSGWHLVQTQWLLHWVLS